MWSLLRSANCGNHVLVNQSHQAHHSVLMQDLRFSQQCWWRYMSYRMWCCVVWLLDPCVLKDHSAFIIKLKQSKKSKLLGLLGPSRWRHYDPRNIRKYLPKYKASQPRQLHLHFVLYKLSLFKISCPLTLGQYCLISKSVGQKHNEDKYVPKTAQAFTRIKYYSHYEQVQPFYSESFKHALPLTWL